MISIRQKTLKEMRKEMFGQLKQRLDQNSTPEDDIFYYHSSEDRIVLSHALFWIMTQSLGGKISKEKFFLLLRQYQEEILRPILQNQKISVTCFPIAIPFTT